MTYGLEFMGKDWDSFSNNTNSALGGQSPANKNEKTPFTKRGKPIGGWCEKDRQANRNFQKWNEEWAREALRICKPGAFMFVCGGSRTFHRLACAVEDAGWIIRDDIMALSSMSDRERALFASLNLDQQQAFLELFASQSLLLWTYGSGFPKGLDISKSIDKKLGKEREVVDQRKHPTLKDTNKLEEQANAAHGENKWAREWDLTSPSSEQAKLFDGYNVSLKPAFEPILVCMKKTDGSFADNALKWGIAGINVDAGRIGTTENCGRPQGTMPHPMDWGNKSNENKTFVTEGNPKGRYPANLILQHSPDCVRIGEKKVKGSGTSRTFHAAYDGESTTKFLRGVSHPGNQHADENGNETIEEWDCSPSCPIRQMNESVGIKKSGLLKAGHPYGLGNGQNVYAKLSGATKSDTHADEGHVSRYFKNLPPETPRFLYFPKASRAERGENNNHPTVKSLALIRELVKLLTVPQNTLILDMFAGSGTLGVACEQLKIPYILIEKEEEYCDIIRARVAAANEPDKPVKRKKIQKPTNTLIPWEEISNDQNA